MGLGSEFYQSKFAIVILRVLFEVVNLINPISYDGLQFIAKIMAFSNLVPLEGNRVKIITTQFEVWIEFLPITNNKYLQHVPKKMSILHMGTLHRNRQFLKKTFHTLEKYHMWNWARQFFLSQRNENNNY